MERLMHAAGLRGTYLHVVSLATVGLCVGLWIRAKAIDQEERGNAERRALFVGLWPPMFWLIGDSLRRWERYGQVTAVARGGARRGARARRP